MTSRTVMGDTVRIARERARRSQADVAIEAGVGRSTVSRLERGLPVSKSSADQIMVALDLTAEFRTVPLPKAPEPPASWVDHAYAVLTHRASLVAIALLAGFSAGSTLN